MDLSEIRGGIPELAEMVVELDIGLSVARHRRALTAGAA
jgi:hypothetical protein